MTNEQLGSSSTFWIIFTFMLMILMWMKSNGIS